MFIVFPEVKTLPAIPAEFGNLISPTPSPIATLEKSSCVFSSLRNNVALSALSILVASSITLFKSELKSISAVTSETILTNSISCSCFF